MDRTGIAFGALLIVSDAKFIEKSTYKSFDYSKTCVLNRNLRT